ncbi:hypothetical protein D3C75_1065010 [compost metagenome]
MDQLAVGLDAVAEHISERLGHHGNTLNLLNLGDAVDRFQGVVEEMGVNLGFQRLHLRIHRQNFVLVAFPDKVVDVLHHFVILRVQEADFIHALGQYVGGDEFMGFIFAHNDSQAGNRLGNPVRQEHRQQDENNGAGEGNINNQLTRDSIFII